MVNKLYQKIQQTDLKNACRLCLAEEASFVDICSTKIRSMIEDCCDIKILAKSELSNNICVACSRQITKFYAFKTKVFKINKLLKRYISNKSRTRDILNIAVEKSNINDTESLNNQDGLSFGGEDVPLNPNLKPATADSKVLEINSIVNYNLKQETCIPPLESNKKSNILRYNFGFEPPPLIPINKENPPDPFKPEKSSNKEAIANIPETILRENVVSPPPLVPLNPVTINIKVIENNELQTDLKFACPKCKEEFESADLLDTHKLKCALNAKTFQCNICRKTFVERKKLIGHLKGHKVVKDYLCNICGKRYASPSSFTIHIRTHTGERPFKCSICNKGFVRWSGVTNHMKTHENSKPFECDICGKGFKVAPNLQRHKQLHLQVYTFKCSYCNKSFSQSDHLKFHVRMYHTNEKPFLCSVCGRGFVSFHRLKRHSWVHTGYKPHSCKLCPKAYSNSNDLKNHQIKVHSSPESIDKLKKYACLVCNLKFRHPCRLTKHLKTHQNGDKKCERCDLSFTNAQVFRKHLEKCN